MEWETYTKVHSNQEIAGVDKIDMDQFDAQRSKHQYKLWNRIAHGVAIFPHQSKRQRFRKKKVEFVSMEFRLSATGCHNWW